MNLPWWQESKDNADVKNLIKILNKNHSGLDKVKERVVEYLAVQLRTKKLKGPIMCLVGPPGVGKSSLAKSIAEALNKRFVKVSLGGVHDESEIRGHRKTYLGSMPGRILKGMARAKVINPLFLLDEIDKMTSSNQGYPSGALLEVLDPELNNKFSDNYVEEDYDLSKVMFVATANYIEDIPEALLDRMEVIELTSYTEQEKLQITKSHLVKRCLDDAEIKTDDLKFTDEGISYIIKFYTREAGVRQLERLIQQIVRKYIVNLQKTGEQQVVVDVDLVKKYLKKEIFDYTVRDEDALPGIVNGMAYTPTGGDLLPIEVTHVAGKGDLILTGNLKQTMRESASVALGYVKANAQSFNINPNLFKKVDINIHVPGGGIPKDGPSAGAALVTAIISSLTGKKVDPKIAMTGEITLRGKVMTIGGVKEKTISAYRGGVRTIFMPEKNERYLDEVPKDIVKDLEIILVKEYKDIYNKIFN